MDNPSQFKVNRRFLLLAFIGVITLFTPGLYAQTPQKGGTALTGTVLGSDGKPVAAATINCQSSGGLAPHVAHSDAKGKFIFQGLKQDSYDLRATANGWYSNWQKNIPLRRGQTKDVTLRLNKAAVPATLPVTHVEQPH
jgi:hypothetical protein